MLFIGDAIFPGGNDYPAAEIGLDTVRVRDVAETTDLAASEPEKLAQLIAAWNDYAKETGVVVPGNG